MGARSSADTLACSRPLSRILFQGLCPNQLGYIPARIGELDLSGIIINCRPLYYGMACLSALFSFPLQQNYLCPLRFACCCINGPRNFFPCKHSKYTLFFLPSFIHSLALIHRAETGHSTDRPGSRHAHGEKSALLISYSDLHSRKHD